MNLKTNHPVVNIILIVMALILFGSIISAVLGIVSGLLWFSIKLLIPLAIAVWLVRLITGQGRGRSRRYY